MYQIMSGHTYGNKANGFCKSNPNANHSHSHSHNHNPNPTLILTDHIYANRVDSFHTVFSKWMLIKLSKKQIKEYAVHR